jgi:hypothetical protein
VLEDAWKKCVIQQTAEFVSFDTSALTKQPLGLQRHLLRRAIESIHPDNLDITFATLERAANSSTTRTTVRAST